MTIALNEWVRPIAYCEIDEYAQGVLFSRMADSLIAEAPIWPDIRSLRGADLPAVDIIYGGFPCQDISVAGTGKGLEGERSGLFFEILRLAQEIKPQFIFLENVSAIRTRGASRVCKELAAGGYDCRWDCITASQVGAPHIRERWFLLAYANGTNIRIEPGRSSREDGQKAIQLRRNGKDESVANTKSSGCGQGNQNAGGNSKGNAAPEEWPRPSDNGLLENADCKTSYNGRSQKPRSSEGVGAISMPSGSSWWTVEPEVGRVVNGLPLRVDRIKCLGNAVVPLQAKTAFKKLMGL